MNVCGIVGEWHPFHLGHQYLIKEINAILPNTTIISVMSGSFTQRGDAAIFDKWCRTKMALAQGVDLIIELNQYWATSSMENFARGSILTLLATGQLTHLAFGSETCDLSELMTAAKLLRSPTYSYVNLIKSLQKSGQSYASAQQEALYHETGISNLQNRPNDRLAIQYLSILNTDVLPLLIKRQWNHNSTNSGSHIRKLIYSQADVRHLLPKSSINFMMDVINNNWKLPTMNDLFLILKHYFLLHSNLSDSTNSKISYENYQRYYRAIVHTNSFEEFLKNVLTRQLHQGRVQRDILNILAPTIELSSPLYLRVLGATQRGLALLSKMKSTCHIPIITTLGRQSKYINNPIKKALKNDLDRQNLSALLQNVQPFNIINRDYYQPMIVM